MFKKITTKSNLIQLVSVAEKIWHEHYTSIVGKNQVQYMLDNLHSVDVLLNQIKHEGFHYYLIRKEQEDLGYCGIQIREKDVFLCKLYFHRKHRSKGFGRKTLRFIKKIALQNNRKLISIRVNKGNISAVVLCHRMGFVKVGEMCTNIGSSYVMDDLVMELALD